MFENKSRYSFEEFKDFQFFHAKPTIIFYIAFFALLIAIGGIVAIFDLTLGITIMVTVAVIVLIFLLTFKKQLVKRLKKFAATSREINDDSVSAFVFNEKDFTNTVTVGAEESSSRRTSYASIYKIVEHKNYIFIYISKFQAFVMQRSGMTKGTAYELKDFFVNKLGLKYIGGN